MAGMAFTISGHGGEGMAAERGHEAEASALAFGASPIARRSQLGRPWLATVPTTAAPSAITQACEKRPHRTLSLARDCLAVGARPRMGVGAAQVPLRHRESPRADRSGGPNAR